MRMLVFRSHNHPSTKFPITFGPFNFTAQRRWKKPADTAQTRLENRTRDLKLDKLVTYQRKLKTALHLLELMSKRRGPYVSVQIMSRWASVVGLNISVSEFLRKYPHVFEIFTHPVRRNACCRVTSKMLDLIDEEVAAVSECELESVRRVKKLLMMSKGGVIHIHALGLVTRELGLPEDFRDSILRKHSAEFKVIDLERVGLVEKDESLATAEVEKWREREYREKWLSEFETKYAFPVNFPTGFKMEKGFKERLKNWQRMPYIKPYENETTRGRSAGAIQRFEKRVVGILHEFLSLTVEKMIEVERFAHFRRDLGIEVNIRELLLKHPGIFYISTKGQNHTVFLRETYNKHCLVEPNPIYIVRRKMLDLLLLGSRNTRELNSIEATEEERRPARDKIVQGSMEGTTDGFWIIPYLESFDNTSDSPEEELQNGGK
ncbi:hypothetical protein Ancab_001038 [Ancistrocladus abbreviatus]